MRNRGESARLETPAEIVEGEGEFEIGLRREKHEDMRSRRRSLPCPMFSCQDLQSFMPFDERRTSLRPVLALVAGLMMIKRFFAKFLWSIPVIANEPSFSSSSCCSSGSGMARPSSSRGAKPISGWRATASISAPRYWGGGPLVPFLIRVGTFFFGDTELGVRWLAAVIACLTGFTLFYLARHWFNARAAFWTLVLFVVVPMFRVEAFLHDRGDGEHRPDGAGHAGVLPRDRGRQAGLVAAGRPGLRAGTARLAGQRAGGSWACCSIFVVDRDRRPRLREPLLWTTIIFATLFLAPIIWWWHGPQVADIRRVRLVNDWPLSHAFSMNQGFHFLGLEAFYLCPLFLIVLVVLLARLGRAVWMEPRYALLVCLARAGADLGKLCGLFPGRPLRIGPGALPAAGAAGGLLHGTAFGKRAQPPLDLGRRFSSSRRSSRWRASTNIISPTTTAAAGNSSA